MDDQKDQILKNMEFLMEELHKEWERSGKTRAVIIISMEQTEAVNKKLAAVIHKNTDQLEQEDTTFEESVARSRENYVLLRMLRKVKAAEDRGRNSKSAYEFSVELDKEEYRLFQDVVGAEEEQ